MFGWLRNRRSERTRIEPGVMNATTFVSSDLEGYREVWGRSGIGGVSPATAMRHSTVYACVRIIAGSIAALPVEIYERDADGSERELPADPMAYLLGVEPNTRMSATTFWRQMVSQMLLRGNGIAWIERKGSGEPVALWPIPMQRVSVDLIRNRLRYQLTLDDGTIIVVDQDDVLHVPGTVEWNGLTSKTPIEAYAMPVGIGLEADRYAKKFFENDATPASYVSYPGKFQNGSDQKEEIRTYFKQKFGGENRHSGPAVFDQGGEVKQLDIKASDAQLLETRQFQVLDIARIFGVPLHLLNATEKDTGPGRNIEQQQIAFRQTALAMHIVAIESECRRKLFRRSGRYCAFDTNQLERGDMKGRFEAYRIALGGSSGPGFLVANEVRRLEGWRPREGGEELVKWSAREQQGKGDAQADATSGEQQGQDQEGD